MKKLFFILCLIVCAHSAATELPSQAESSVEQLVRIMMSNTKRWDQCPSILAEKRNPNDYQEVYNLATKHPKLLKGIIHDGRTFAMLCIQRGYADVLERLINEDYPVDITTPCNLYANPDEPETTVLHILFLEVSKVRKFKDCHSEDYIERITGLTKLIINKDPSLLDMPVKKAPTARSQAIFLWRNLGDLIPRDLPQSANDNSVK